MDGTSQACAQNIGGLTFWPKNVNLKGSSSADFCFKMGVKWILKFGSQPKPKGLGCAKMGERGADLDKMDFSNIYCVNRNEDFVKSANI